MLTVETRGFEKEAMETVERNISIEQNLKRDSRLRQMQTRYRESLRGMAKMKRWRQARRESNQPNDWKRKGLDNVERR